MSEEDEQGAELEPRLIKLHCHRTGRQLELAEHEQCPYCFGPRSELEAGRRVHFCEYKPGQDPVHFGFPPDTLRDATG